MMGAFLLELFKSFLRLIKGLDLYLEEGSDVIPKLGYLSWVENICKEMPWIEPPKW